MPQQPRKASTATTSSKLVDIYLKLHSHAGCWMLCWRPVQQQVHHLTFTAKYDICSMNAYRKEVCENWGWWPKKECLWKHIEEHLINVEWGQEVFFVFFLASMLWMSGPRSKNGKRTLFYNFLLSCFFLDYLAIIIEDLYSSVIIHAYIQFICHV